MIKNLPASAGDTRNTGLICGSGRFLGEEHDTHSSILAWRIPWTEEAGRLESTGLQRVRHTERLTHTHTHTQRKVRQKGK